MFLVLIFSLLNAQVLAQQAPTQSNKPLVELGAIGGAALVPDYPASDQSRVRYLALPLVRYRGARLRSDEEDGFKTRLFEDPLFGFDLSFAGSFPAYSKENDARRGMQDLDWIGEFGPRFNYFLIKTPRLWIRWLIPARIAVSTDFTSITYRGLVFAPAFNLRHFFDDGKFNSVLFSVTRTYTTHQLQEYFFEVGPRDATLARPIYDAKSGYLATRAGLAYFYQKHQFAVFSGLGLSSHRGAANAGSPLHRQDYNLSIFFGLSYLFYQSEAKGYL